MEKSSRLVLTVFVLLLFLPLSASLSQERGMENRPPMESHSMESGKMMEEHPGMEWMHHRMAGPHGMHMLQLLQHDPKMMGLLMQMRGEMMLKQGEVLLKYGKMIQSLPAPPGPAKK